MADERRQDRLEREINEILSDIEQFPSAERRRARVRSRMVQRIGKRVSGWQRAVMRSMSGVSLSQLMLLSFLMILGSMFFRRMMPLAWPWMMYGGIILFLVTFTLMFFGRRGGGGGGRDATKYWRGRRVSYQQQPSLSVRLRQWLSRYTGR